MDKSNTDVKDEITEIIKRIKGNLVQTDKNLILLIFDSFNQRLMRLEKKLKPGIFEYLQTGGMYFIGIAILILAFVLWKMQGH